MHTIEIASPYIIFLGDETRIPYVKTGQGILDWHPEICKAQYRLDTDTYDLGLTDMNIQQAVQAGIKTLIIGTAQVAGSIPSNWMPVLLEAAHAGLDIVAGLHTLLKTIPELVNASEDGNARLIDVRIPPTDIPVGNGKKRTGKRLLTVGTDCALGKKYSSLQLTKDMLACGMNVDFRASGQTGIMISGEGIPIDCVVGDFISGAAEVLSPDNDHDHWDIIEGQGGIFHPGYAAVTHGLLLGSQPDAFVVCHEANRCSISSWPDFSIPSIGEVIKLTIEIGKLTNSNIQCVGICVNSSTLKSNERSNYLKQLSESYQLPCVDPLIDGTKAIVKHIQSINFQ